MSEVKKKSLLGRRELIAYMFSGTMCFITIYSVITGLNVETIVTGFIAMANAIIGYYFGRRAGEEQ